MLEDDALIVCLDDLPPPAAANGADKGGEEVDSLLKRNSELQAELEQLSKQFANYRLTVEKTLDERWQADDEPEDAPTTTTKNGKRKDEYYFESYAHNGMPSHPHAVQPNPNPPPPIDIHEVMIKDAVRTDAYRDFIYANKDLFAGKTVLDIGCGTGILSLFCARAGAARVIAVDRSDILDKARENIFSNGLDHIITCVKGRIEDVVLPVTQVDIIVSEWMGYCLLYEAMLPSVLYARDRYLVPGGLLVPSHASMWVAPVSDAEYVADHISFWRDVYGFDFSSAMQRDIYADSRVTTMPAASLCGEPSMFRFLDLHTVKTEELVFTSPWASTLTRTDGALDGFLMWFDMFFARSRDEKSIAPTTTAQEWVKAGKTPDEHVAFTTGPAGIETHWRQILFLVDAQKKKIRQLGDADKGKKVEGEVSYITAEDHERGLEIKVTWKVEGEEGDAQSWGLH